MNQDTHFLKEALKEAKKAFDPLTKALKDVADVEKQYRRGIITDGDLRRHFQAHAWNAATRASDLMTASPRSISTSALAVEARELMEQNKIQHLLIHDDAQKLVGVIHLHDLLRARVV